jgi:hypothetical protein
MPFYFPGTGGPVRRLYPPHTDRLAGKMMPAMFLRHAHLTFTRFGHSDGVTVKTLHWIFSSWMLLLKGHLLPWTPGNFGPPRDRLYEVNLCWHRHLLRRRDREYGCSFCFHSSASRYLRECNEKVQVGKPVFQVYPNPSLRSAIWSSFQQYKQISRSSYRHVPTHVMQLNSVAVQASRYPAGIEKMDREHTYLRLRRMTRLRQHQLLYCNRIIIKEYYRKDLPRHQLGFKAGIKKPLKSLLKRPGKTLCSYPVASFCCAVRLFAEGNILLKRIPLNLPGRCFPKNTR